MKIGDFEITPPAPKLQDAHCIAMLRPWVNVGNVGAIVLGRLAKLYGAQEIGRLARPGKFYDFTRYRPEIRFVNSERTIRVPNTVAMAARREDGPDFVFLQMMEPHGNAEDFNDSVLALLRELGVSRYVLIGGMYDSVPHSRPLLVTGSARGWAPPPDFGGVRIGRSSYQGPTSLTSQLTDRARNELDVETLSLIVHLPLYLKLEDDYAGSARLLTALSALYGFSESLPEVEMGERQYSQVTPAMGNNPQLQELVQKFEAEYDQQSGDADIDQFSLSPEIERFLEDVARKAGEEPGDDQSRGDEM
ncbi:MAG: PAC2 family protein [Dehalococcoidia bacterium]